ncbi:MAG: 50S ribosomal protein L4 [Candidatus Shapirobacteria bacterium]
MKLPIYNLTSKTSSSVTLPSSVFGAKINSGIISQAIKVYLANQRSSHAKTKSRHEVAGTTKKMWAQKGTGRARHGSAKAPLFVGGGVSHGPRGNRNYVLKLTKSLKAVAYRSILSQFAADNKIIVVKSLSRINPKTKEAVKFLSLLSTDYSALKDNRRLGVISTKPHQNITRSFGNLPQVNLLPMTSINVYDLSRQQFLIISPRSIDKFKKLYGQR